MIYLTRATNIDLVVEYHNQFMAPFITEQVYFFVICMGIQVYINYYVLFVSKKLIMFWFVAACIGYNFGV